MCAGTAPVFDKLYELAERQQGFFGASQARDLGYSRQLQAYHVSTGEWRRKGRGIFRLKHFPPPSFAEGFYTTYLWTLNRDGEPEGVFSHGTALYMHSLSTYVPPVLDVTVPKHFRRHSKPPGKIALHKENIDQAQLQIVSGLRVTNPLKTIVDLLESRSIDYDYILDGLRTALERFTITLKQMQQANLSPKERSELLAALERVGYERRNEIQH